MLLEIRKYPEIELTDDIQQQVALLLQKSFPATNYNGKHYYKQLPHYRFLAYEDEMLIGHAAIDFRMMALNDQLVKVFGIIDLCVLEERRNHYIGSFLLEEVEKLAAAANADFIAAFTANGSIYARHGYSSVENISTWLELKENRSTSVEHGFLQNEIIIKELSGKKWEAGNLDFLGYK